MARRVRGLFENQKLTYFGASGVSERAYQKNLRSSRVCGTFLFFFGNYIGQEVRLYVADTRDQFAPRLKVAGRALYF